MDRKANMLKLYRIYVNKFLKNSKKLHRLKQALAIIL